jgi:hypothetical protein
MIEHNTLAGRGVCRNFNDGKCALKREYAFDRLKVCHNCPKWTELDILYESITGRGIMHTYDWWRQEWIEHDIPYAKERMETFVTEHAPSPEPPEVSARHADVWDWIANRTLDAAHWPPVRTIQLVFLALILVLNIFGQIHGWW